MRARLGHNMMSLTRDLAEVLKGGVDRAFKDEVDTATGEKWQRFWPSFPAGSRTTTRGIPTRGCG